MSGISQEALDYLESVLDTKIAKATNSEQNTYRARVMSTDDHDTTWIQVPGIETTVPVDVRLVEANDGDIVSATFQDGMVILDGNQSFPAPSSATIGDIAENSVIASMANGSLHGILGEYVESVTVNTLTANYANLAHAVIDNAIVKNLFAEKADIDFANIDVASIEKAKIDQLIAGTAIIDDLQATAATIESLDVEALNAAAAYIGDLETESITTQQLAAAAAYIAALTAGTITAQDIISGHATITNLDANYAKIANGKIINADIDFAHVDVVNAQLAKVAQLFSVLGMVDDLTVADGHITGKLTAVEIDGDVANISNIHADSLYILGDDGLYYALNVNAMGQAAASQLPAAMQEQLKGGLHGQNIIAGTVTADKIYVTDIAAFGATIAGMVFGTSNGMYTVHTAGKTAVNSPTAGVYSDSSGQFTVGDGANFLTLYKGSDNEWHLDISAENITLGGGRVITDLDVAVTQTSTGADITVNGDTVHLTNGQAGDSITVSSVKYTTSDTETQPADSAFTDTTVPTVPEGKWLWTKTTYSDGTSTYTKSKQGQKGDQGVSVTNVTSTNNTSAGGTSVVTVTLSDGTTKTFNVKNGSNGETAQWYYGTALTHTSGTATLAATSTSGAVVGSMYLNTQTSLVYKCTAVGTNNTWTYAGDLTTGVLDNINVGGRNYIFNSNDILADNRGSAAGSQKEYIALDLGKSYMGVPEGTQVTVSFDIVMDVATANPTLQVYNTNNDGPKCFSGTSGHGEGSGVTYPFTAAAGSTINERVSVTGYIRDRDNPAKDTNWLEFYSTYGSSNFFSIANLKLEVGNVPTDWTPAPEDVDDSISTSAETTAENARIYTDNKAGEFSAQVEQAKVFASEEAASALQTATDIASLDATAKASQAEVNAKGYADTAASEAAASALTGAQTYTNRYVSDLSNGVFVHPKDVTSKGVEITDSVKIILDNATIAEYGEMAIIGDRHGSHIEVSPSGIDFYSSAGERVGYIETVNGNSVFRMTHAVIVQNLRFANWEWRQRGNGNLSLKHIGDDL